MNLFDRIYGLHKTLSAARYPVSKQALQERLECSPATVKRIIRDMRLYLDAPIEYDRDLNGYYYAAAGAAGDRFELPGLWFNESEVVSLLVMDRLLETTEPGLLGRELAPVRKRLETILASQHLGAGELPRKVRILRAAARPVGPHFQALAGSLAAGRRLALVYHGRGRDTVTERVVSPQRLVYYRDNWYLDAWCHRADGLRTFAVDRVREVRSLDRTCRRVREADLDAELAAGYGIFAGAAPQTAVLRFSPQAARWVADETWHPDQRGEWLMSGGYELRVPYAEPEELIRTVLSHGPEVEVVAPVTLRRAVTARLRSSVSVYADDEEGDRVTD